MRSRFVPRAAALLLVLAALGLGAAAAPPVAVPAPGENTLEDVMQGLKTQLKKLSGALEAKKAPDALDAVGEMQRLVLLAKTHEPPKQGKPSKDEQAALTLAFRKDLIAVLRELADVEVNVLDAKYDEAVKQVQGPLSDMRDAGHKKYKDKNSSGGR